MSAPPQEDVELLPDLQNWNRGNGISIAEWIRLVGNHEHAIGYSRVFWPQFVEMEGCIVWADVDVQRLREWKAHVKGDLRKVEGTVNHWHMADLFCGHSPDPTRAQLRYLGRLLREMWQSKLDRDFPDRHVRVVFIDPEGECDLLDYQVTFYQDPPAP